MHEIVFTKKSIEKLPCPERGMRSYRDIKERGLSLYVTANGTVSFFVRKHISGRDERVIIGQYPTITIEQARKQAAQAKAQIAQGINPNLQRRKLSQEITFGVLFQQFMERYSKAEKRSWQYDQREVNKFLGNWFNRKISTIPKHEIQAVHERVRKENGLYQANRLLERVRAIFNKAIEWGWDGTNPSSGIRKFKEKSRDRFLQPNELPRFFAALNAETSEPARDYVWLSLLTGARKANVLGMRWDEINWERAEWRIPETKNGEPLTIPLVEQAVVILRVRRNGAKGAFVFPQAENPKKHLADPKRAWARILKRASIVDLRLHDIRRTLGSYQALTGASLPIIGKSLGHKSQATTGVYARLNLDPVRASVQKAIDAMMALSMVGNGQEVHSSGVPDR